MHELDNGGTVGDLSTGGSLQFYVDMSTAKTVSVAGTKIGSQVTFTLTANNLSTGSGQATGVQVVDTLPARVSFVSATPSVRTWGGTSIVTCDFGDVSNGTSASVDVVVTVDSIGSYQSLPD